jgi:hypothetical protein
MKASYLVKKCRKKRIIVINIRASETSEFICIWPALLIGNNRVTKSLNSKITVELNYSSRHFTSIQKPIRPTLIDDYPSWMKKIILLLSALVLTAASYGQVLISWDINGVDLDDGSHSAPYTIAGVADANIAGGNLSLSSSVNPTTSAGQYGFKVSETGTPSLANSITEGYYIQFTVVAALGFDFSISSIEWKGGSTTSGADNIADVGTDGGYDATMSSGSFDSSYNNLTSITFRVYGWNISGSSGRTNFRSLSGDDLIINGTTAVSAVPEPSTYPLIFGAATLSYVMYRRCTKRVS